MSFSVRPLVGKISAVSPQQDGAYPLAFDISIAVRRADAQLQAALDGVLKRRRGDVRQLLQRYDVPVVSGASRRFARSME